MEVVATDDLSGVSSNVPPSSKWIELKDPNFVTSLWSMARLFS